MVTNAIYHISNITNKDYIEIVGTFTTMTNPVFRCQDCLKKYKNEPDRRLKHEENMLCKRIDERPRHYFKAEGLQKINFKTCIGNMFDGEWSSWINYFQHYQKGQLPFDGAFENQPSKFVDLMNLVDNLIQEDQRSKQESLKKISNGKQSSPGRNINRGKGGS